MQQPGRRRANKVILIVAGSIMGLFVLIALIGAAVGGGNESNAAATVGTPSPSAAKPSASASSPAVQPSAQGTHLASQAVRDKAAQILTAATDHYAQVFARGQKIVGTT